MMFSAQNNAPENLSRTNWRIAFLASIAARQKTIPRGIRKDQAMSTHPSDGPGDDNVANL